MYNNKKVPQVAMSTFMLHYDTTPQKCQQDDFETDQIPER